MHCSDANNRPGYTDLTQKPAAIKQWIATKGPVSACFNVYEDFYYYQGGVYRHITGAHLDGHCVTIIGCDDQQGC
ncbi:C1 family peptidase [Bacillus toyonensis]|uniref:C1 family peptidase n=1 Tax=Bacillus toyonensis TaxID=155322 RepID=UPI0020D28B0B|nr:C1 family peptidase [Bacillus toyonensis]